jgi:hypothetical protein
MRVISTSAGSTKAETVPPAANRLQTKGLLDLATVEYPRDEQDEEGERDPDDIMTADDNALRVRRPRRSVLASPWAPRRTRKWCGTG